MMIKKIFGQNQSSDKLIRALVFALVIIVGYLLLRPSDHQPVIPESDNSVYSDFQTIDSLRTEIMNQKEANCEATLTIQRLSKQLDSTKELLGQADQRLNEIKKRKQYEKTADYSRFSDNELARYLSDRYGKSSDLHP